MIGFAELLDVTLPDAEDVREGIGFGFGGELTGTLLQVDTSDIEQSVEKITSLVKRFLIQKGPAQCCEYEFNQGQDYTGENSLTFPLTQFANDGEMASLNIADSHGVFFSSNAGLVVDQKITIDAIGILTGFNSDRGFFDVTTTDSESNTVRHHAMVPFTFRPAITA